MNELNSDDVKEANIKLNILLKKSNEGGLDNVILVFLFILVATGVILYFLYKWTYYIQPDYQIELANKILNQMGYNY